MQEQQNARETAKLLNQELTDMTRLHSDIVRVNKVLFNTLKDNGVSKLSHGWHRRPPFGEDGLA